MTNGLARSGDYKILEYPTASDFILVTTDNDFELLAPKHPGVRIVILRACNYPTAVAANVLRRNAIRITDRPRWREPILILEK